MQDKKLILDHTTIHVASYQEFEPIMYGNGEGFEADILRAIAKLWGTKIQFHPQKNYLNIWNSPENENYDLAAGGITPQSDRRKDALFSIPTAHYSQSLLVKKSDYISGKIRDFNSFKDRTLQKIGVVKDSAGEKFGKLRAKECDIKRDIFVYYTSESELVPALLNNEIAAIARGEIGNEFQTSLHPELVTIAKRNFGEAFTFAVNPDREEFLAELNNAIHVVTDSGKLSYQEWRQNKQIFMKKVEELYAESHIALGNPPPIND